MRTRLIIILKERVRVSARVDKRLSSKKSMWIRKNVEDVASLQHSAVQRQ